MNIQIRWGEVDKTEKLETFVNEQVSHAIRHHADDLTRVEVHLHDDNGEKAGANDKRCVIEARPAGGQPLIVDGTGEDELKTVASVAKKLERVVRNHFDKLRSHRV